MRTGLAVAAIVALLTACGGGMSLTEYAETVEVALEEMNGRIQQLDEERSAQPPSVDATRSYFAGRLATRDEFMEVFRPLDPPPEARDLHDTATEIVDELIAAERALADRLDEIETLDELAEVMVGPEVRAMEEVDARAQDVCAAAQQTVDETADREVLGSTNWIPPSLKEVVDVAFRCTAERP